MAVGLSAAYANSMLNAAFRGTSWDPGDNVWIKLHVGDPGSAGTSNAATNTTRQQATFGSNASGGTISNTASVDWTSVAGTEDYTHWSAWDASTSGNFIASGTITANAVTTGDNFSLPIGEIDMTMTNVAA